MEASRINLIWPSFFFPLPPQRALCCEKNTWKLQRAEKEEEEENEKNLNFYFCSSARSSNGKFMNSAQRKKECSAKREREFEKFIFLYSTLPLLTAHCAPYRVSISDGNFIIARHRREKENERNKIDHWENVFETHFLNSGAFCPPKSIICRIREKFLEWKLRIISFSALCHCDDLTLGVNCTCNDEKEFLV